MLIYSGAGTVSGGPVEDMRLNSQLWGFFPYDMGLGADFNFSAAANWMARGFRLTEAKTLNTLRIHFSVSGGTMPGSDFAVDVYSDNAGVPNASLGTFTGPAGSFAAGVSQFFDFTGLSLSLSANTQYWLVIRNANASPGTNRFLQNVTASDSIYAQIAGGHAGFGWGLKTSTNSGTSWTGNNQNASIGRFRLGFSDSTYAGFPVSNTGTILETIYGSREFGVLFTSPARDLKVVGAAMRFYKGSTPTVDPLVKLYNGLTQLGSNSSTVPRGLINSGSVLWWPFYFPSVITVPASSSIRLVLAEPGSSDLVANRYNIDGYNVDNTAASKALVGGYKGTLSTNGGTSFSDDDTQAPFFALILDSDGEIG